MRETNASSFFALDRAANVVMRLKPNEPFQSVLLCESGNDTGAMLIGTFQQVTRDADIKNAVTSIRHDVNEAASHERSKQDVDGRDKPGHDGVRDSGRVSQHRQARP